jgi:hypothetical protein
MPTTSDRYGGVCDPWVVVDVAAFRGRDGAAVDDARAPV